MNVDLILKITDYVLLNAYSLSSSGLYYGKAGVSLALFEISRLLENDYLEEHAFELLQEALLYKGDDLSFMNGYAGISFVLHYLMDNDFVEADADELVGEQERKLQSEAPCEIPVTDLSFSALSACIDRLFLLHRDLERDKEEIEVLQSFLFSSSEEELEAKLLKIMNSAGANISYAHGLARWLLYGAYTESLERGLDVSRFDNLFKLVPIWKR